MAVDLDQLRTGAAASVNHPLSRALLALTFTTGVIDAVSFLGLGNVFTANMTGNVLFLGFGIAGAGELPVLAPLLSLAAFLLGAAVGGLVAATGHPTGFARALAIETVMVGAAAIVAVVIAIEPREASADALIVMLAAAMGVRNAVVRKLAVPDLKTTLLTMSVTGFAADSPLVGGSGRGSTRRAAAVGAMLAGAVAGALLLKTSVELALAAAALVAVLVAVTYVPATRRLG